MKKVWAGFTALVFAATLLAGIFLPKLGLAVSREEAKAILGENMIGPEQVLNVLASRGVYIRLSSEEKEKLKNIPFSEQALRQAAIGRWHGKAGILWPALGDFPLLRLRQVFGTNAENQPFFEAPASQGWWLNEGFAKKEILKQGWHFTTLEMPGSTFDKARGTQIELLSEDENLLSPVETAYLMLVYFAVYPEARLVSDGWSRTSTIASSGGTVGIGFYRSGGIALQELPFWGRADIGAMIAKKKPGGE